MSGNQHTSQTTVATHLYIASALRDASKTHKNLLPSQGPVAVAVNNSRIIAAGTLADVEHAIDSGTVKRTNLPNHLLLPGLVNTHTHLDLTHIGPKPYTGSFIDWVKMVIAYRPTDPQSIHAAVSHGLKLSKQSGTLTLGDIAGTTHATRALHNANLNAVSFAELIGLDPPPLQDILAPFRSDARPNTTIGLQPHAPYSTAPNLYTKAAHTSAPLSTHLAETPEELRFIANATGPFRELLESLNKWDERYLAHYNSGLHPVDWLAKLSPPNTPWLCAHCNYVDDSHIDTIASNNWSVAYCPRASDYFGHHNHRYRDMLHAGINVSLGTDSIICHQSLSILDEMRHLYQRDRTDPDLLLRMATTNGAAALVGINIDTTLTPNASPGLIAIPYDPDPNNTKFDPLQSVLAQNQTPPVRTLELPTRT